MVKMRVAIKLKQQHSVYVAFCYDSVILTLYSHLVVVRYSRPRLIDLHHTAGRSRCGVWGSVRQPYVRHCWAKDADPPYKNPGDDINGARSGKSL